MLIERDCFIKLKCSLTDEIFLHPSTFFMSILLKLFRFSVKSFLFLVKGFENYKKLYILYACEN